MDLKYDLLKHPNVALTADGGKAAYRHGQVRDSVATISLAPLMLKAEAGTTMEESGASYELLAEADLEEEQIQRGEQNETFI